MQIFFVEERQHWIATSLFKGELYLYDSCFNGTLSPSTELQIAQVYSPLIQCNGLLISVVALQQQEGANNCGLFSIAVASIPGRVFAFITVRQNRYKSKNSAWDRG